VRKPSGPGMTRERAPRNRTLSCSDQEILGFSQSLRRLTECLTADALDNVVANQDLFEAAEFLPKGFADLVVIDPPYNLSKDFNGQAFKARGKDEYSSWFEAVLEIVVPTLTPHGSVYVCSDWKTSILIAPLLEKRLRVRNRITWEREKGRGARANWKNNTEDIWFCTASDSYYFNVDAVKLKRKVIAPYRSDDGQPKDWEESADGNYRLTHPANFWSDITIPFWSMSENTDHPTQKPEKLIAKLILASTVRGGCVFDPFLGSGTTAVVAKKLGRRFLGVEQNTEYCCWALKRLEAAERDSSIQGYVDGIFWERNSLSHQKVDRGGPAASAESAGDLGLFK